MNYNKSEIMKKAWEMFRTRKAIGLAISFAQALRMAWCEARNRVEAARRNNSLTVAEKIARIEESLFNLQMKDRFSSSDRELERKWRQELNELKAA